LDNVIRGNFKQAAETLVIGGGRMATQFKQFLKNVEVPYHSWLRSEGVFTLGSRVRDVKRVLLLIPDKLITSFVDENENFLKNKTLIHFSATGRDPRVLGFHPLGSFTVDQLLDFSEVQFHGVHPESLFREALPFLKNSYKQMSEKDMQLYHALCVLGGNFSSILWNVFFTEMKKIGISDAACKTYFKMISDNILKNPSTAITGPLVRNDLPTIEKNISALQEHPALQEIYKNFVRVFSDKATNSEYLK
jgi:hypothetical protein